MAPTGRDEPQGVGMTGPTPGAFGAWPGFRPDGGLRLEVPSELMARPCSRVLESEGVRFHRKPEFHLTLLNRPLGAVLRGLLGEERIRSIFGDQDWMIRRTGEGHLLRKVELDGTQSLACGSIIEQVGLSALTAFRRALGSSAGMEVPDVLPHVTLYTAGHAAGIGLADMASFEAARVARLRIPGVCNRHAPDLPTMLLQAYEATEFVIGEPAAILRVGHASVAMDSAFRDNGTTHAIVVTACNPFSETTDPRANELRRHMLRDELQRAGLPVCHAEGRDPAGVWPPEPGLLVFGTSRELEDRLLRDYEQHAIVVVEQGEPVGLALHPDHRASRA